MKIGRIEQLTDTGTTSPIKDLKIVLAGTAQDLTNRYREALEKIISIGTPPEDCSFQGCDSCRMILTARKALEP